MHHSLSSTCTRHYRLQSDTFSAPIFWHYLVRGLENNASHTKLLHPTTACMSTVSANMGGAWGMHGLVHKWGEIVVFIQHFFTLSHTKTSFVAYFQRLDKIKQFKWPLWVLFEVVLLGNKQ